MSNKEKKNQAIAVVSRMAWIFVQRWQGHATKTRPRQRRYARLTENNVGYVQLEKAMIMTSMNDG